MNPYQLTKKQLRSHMRAKLKSLSPSSKNQQSINTVHQITSLVKANPHIITIATYAATPSEINLSSLHSALPNASLCYPKCSAKGQMEFHSVTDPKEMLTSNLGIPEPIPESHPLIPPHSIDLLLCPALAFTTDGKRLGKGGGYYDRFLPRINPHAVTIGIAFPIQIINHIPTEPHDLKVHRLL